MKRFFRSIWGQLLLGLLCVAAVVFSLFCVYQYEEYRKPKFRDVTIELGADSLSIQDFLTEDADPGRVGFVSDVSSLDIGKVGTYPLTLAQGKKVETVRLKVQDTVPPTAEFSTEITRAMDYIPDPQDFVVSYFDLDQVTLSFAEAPVIPEDFSDLSLTVVVSDASSNSIRQEVTVKFARLYDAVTLELGQTLTPEMLLYAPQLDMDRIDPKEVEAVNRGGVGQYTIHCVGEEDITCAVTVRDTTAPELKLKNISIEEGKKITLDAFVKSAKDTSGDVRLEFVEEPSGKTGKHTVKIKATDPSGNSTTETAQLTVKYDATPPTIKGIKNMTVTRGSSPNYMKGVSATDNKDKNVTVTCDSSKVNPNKAGTYYATYTAKDASGNVRTAKRKITVQHNAQDTKDLIKSIAAKLSSDPEKLRNYVRSNVRYNHNWGGKDPVWYGFKNKAGNCYVHAKCLEALLKEKGYQCRLIWTIQKSPGHYWLIVKINGTWKHIDPTPGRLHSKYSLMNDAQRLSTLSGRTWDTSKWPACP